MRSVFCNLNSTILPINRYCDGLVMLILIAVNITVLYAIIIFTRKLFMNVKKATRYILPLQQELKSVLKLQPPF